MNWMKQWIIVFCSIISFLSLSYSQNQKMQVIFSADEFEEKGARWEAISQKEEDFEVKLEKTSDFKLEGERCLRFTFKKLTEIHANKHARVEIRIPRSKLNLLSISGNKCYLHVMAEKLPSSYIAGLLVESPYANAVIELTNFDKIKGSFMAIEIDAKKLCEISKTTPRIDPSRITRIFLYFANVEKEESGVIYIDAITDKPLAPVLNPVGEEKNSLSVNIQEISVPYNKPSPILTFSQLKNSIPHIDVPIYVMEYHIWYTSPFGLGHRGGFTHWPIGDLYLVENSDNIPWRKNIGASIGYPLIGFYDSAVEEVIKWQIRCMKESGFDGAFVHLFPLREDGTKFGEEDTIFARILDIAKAEKFHIGIHDEVQFRRGWLAQKPEISAERAGKIIKKFGKHPGYLKLMGKPVYKFQVWDLWGNMITYNDLAYIMKTAEEISGQDIYWILMIFPYPEILSIPDVDAIVVTANSNFIQRGKDYLEGQNLDWIGLEENKIGPVRKVREEIKRAGKKIGLWVYPGFNNSYLSKTADWFDRKGGKTLIDVLKIYKQEKPDFILLSSWNDWVENTAIEPGLSFDDYNGDPYLYCRIIAAAKGKTFVPPPLPKPEAVDPWLHALLYGIDRTPPIITQVWYSPLEPAIEVVAFDQHSKIKQVKGLKYGNGMIRFQDKKVETFRSNLTFPSPSALKFDSAEGKGGLSLSQIPVCKIEFEEVFPSKKIIENTWIHFYYFDGQPGRIIIEYPAEPNIINTFEPRPLLIKLPCSGSNSWRKTVVKLQNLSQSKKLFLTIRFEPSLEKKEEKKPVILGSICLLSDFSQGITGVKTTIETTDNLFKLNNILPDRTLYDWVFIQAEDTNGNFSIPVGVNLADANKFKPTRLK